MVPQSIDQLSQNPRTHIQTSLFCATLSRQGMAMGPGGVPCYLAINATNQPAANVCPVDTFAMIRGEEKLPCCSGSQNVTSDRQTWCLVLSRTWIQDRSTPGHYVDISGGLWLSNTNYFWRRQPPRPFRELGRKCSISLSNVVPWCCQ